MAVRIIKKSWWVDFRFGHTRYRKRSPENTRAGAQAYEAVLRQKLARGEALKNEGTDASENPLFSSFAERWFNDYVNVNNKPATRTSKMYILSAALVPFFGRQRLADIALRDIDRFKARQIETGITNATINERLATLRTCLKTAHAWGVLADSPPIIKPLKARPRHTDFLSEEEARLLLGHTNGLVRELILTTLRTGMRQGELKALQWTSIDWQNRSMTIMHSLCDQTRALDSPKGNRERHIPLDAEVYAILFARRRRQGFVFTDLRGKPFRWTSLNCILARACASAGLRRITWHVLRHTFATQLSMQGVPLNTVQTLLGHSDIATTMRYAHVAPSSLRSAIELLDPGNATAPVAGQPVVNRWIAMQRKKAQANSESQKSLADANRNDMREAA